MKTNELINREIVKQYIKVQFDWREMDIYENLERILDFKDNFSAGEHDKEILSGLKDMNKTLKSILSEIKKPKKKSFFN